VYIDFPLKVLTALFILIPQARRQNVNNDMASCLIFSNIDSEPEMKKHVLFS
jgi:hypothetical protein